MKCFHFIYENFVLYFTSILYYHSRRKSTPATHIADSRWLLSPSTTLPARTPVGSFFIALFAAVCYDNTQ